MTGAKLLLIPEFYTPIKAYMPLINSLAVTLRVAVYELPKHFGADALQNYSTKVFILLFQQLIDHLGWGEFSVYAHGGGCHIAAAL